MASKFVETYLQCVDKKKSIVCLGLDPAIPQQRTKNVIPSNDRVTFMEEMITSLAPFCSTVKMNRQYLIGLSIDEIRNLNKLIHKNGMLSIIDHKLGDIGSTNESAIYWFKEEEFDGFTFSPFAGNIEEATVCAHKYDLGIIVLTLMSNPEAIYQKQPFGEYQAYYEHIAHQVAKYNSDGVVIGATGHVLPEDIKKIQSIVGSETIALVPGVGAQGGSAETILGQFGAKTMVNIGRGIIYVSDPVKEAERYQKELYSQLTEATRNKIRI